jgi:hypothetical protein
MSDQLPAEPTSAANVADEAVASGGAYEVLYRRLTEQGARLRAVAEQLNGERLAEFGSSELSVIGRLRVRTENNCVARDLVRVGDCLLFGYNVFLGLKKETRVEDVFSLYRLIETGDGYDVEPVALADSFLGATGFVQDFRELYAYYKNTRLLQLVQRDDLLLAAFQIGERLDDIRVFRWSVSADGSEIRYIDNRGERDIALPRAWDFEWTRLGREQAVNGRHPHYNVLDTVFVETVHGDLTVKVEDNTEDGLGIYREPVNDQTQSLDDATVDYARVGSLILLRVLPYREEEWRYLVYNTLTRRVQRIDAIGQACVQLPEDHGIVFPGGYTLQNGEYRTFERSMAGMRFKRAVRSPNGEDVLYVFYQPDEGRIALFTYNLIERRLQPPLFGHGYARFDDGRIVLFSADSAEPTRVHPMQVWQTPFASDEYAARQPARDSFLGRIGNPELVRGISDLLSICREIDAEDVSLARFERLAQNARRLFDLHHWIGLPQSHGAGALLREIVASGEAVLDEYEKVESIRQQSERAMREAASRQRELLGGLDPDRWERVQDYVDRLNAITAQRGHLLTIRDYRYIDIAAIDAMEAELLAGYDQVAEATGVFLAGERALQPLTERLRELDAAAQAATSVGQLREPLAGLATLSTDLDMLSNLMTTLQVDDAEQRTRIVEAISAIYARLNQTRARAEQHRRGLGSAEAVAQFAAQFSLFGQSVAGALAQARDPERCDEQLARVLVQLEELESQFGEHEQFLTDILAKREEVLEAFEAQRQALLDDRQRKAQAVYDAALRILDGLGRRTARLSGADELNAFFAGDPLILKLRELGERLRSLRDSVKADDIDARLKAARDQAARSLRDKTDLFEEGGDIIRLGPKHRFSVNRQELDLTLMPRGDGLFLHLTGTDYLEPVQRPELDALRAFWQVALESESAQLYRGEYLAGLLLEAAEAGEGGLTMATLQRELGSPDALARRLREFAAPRYREGYEKGIHDHDAALILQALLPLHDGAGLLRYEADARALALLLWSRLAADAAAAPALERPARRHTAAASADQPADSATLATIALWPARARAARRIRELLGRDDAFRALRQEVAAVLAAQRELRGLPLAADCERSAEYLLQELSAEHPQFVFSKYARRLVDALQARLDAAHGWDEFQHTLQSLHGRLDAAWQLAHGWLEALASEHPELADYVPEAVALLLCADALPSRISEADLRAEVTGLLGDHPRLDGGRLALGIDEFSARLTAHRRDFVPGLQRFLALRHSLLEEQRDAMQLAEFKPRPLSSFVRNRLLDRVYLPLIGDNLAKQIGTVGENKRSDLMGLLLLISPPGYGKTTLMEYVAYQLGLIFMKINGPALGHEVRSLDPAQAPDATAARELEKLNLGLEMGNNVMLYVDDIQHTHPEFLQKFISLCDGTRRIEGVWRGRTRTYDMRGKKFCVVMAGNPYTESGEVFRVPDMLANRADVYNLGDVLGGRQDDFLLSYIENALTSNPVLAPLATRDIGDIYRLLDRAAGREFSANALSHSYSGAEINELTAVLQHMLTVRERIFRVNQQYIASAAQADAYRTEPAFKLQGSYRNMSKLAEKISPVMNATELDQLLHDHYLGESQLLTSGAEENLLKLGEMFGTLSEADAARWAAIKRDYQRNKAIGGADSDVGTRVVAQLHDLVQGVRGLVPAEEAPAEPGDPPPWPQLVELLERIASEQTLARTFNRDSATDSAMWLGGLRSALEVGFRPLIGSLDERNAQRGEQQALLAAIVDRLGRLLERTPGPASAPARPPAAATARPADAAPARPPAKPVKRTPPTG